MSRGGMGKRMRVARLWLRDPHCRCCGRMTVLPTAILVERNGRKYLPKPVPPDLATLQHFDSRLNGLRGTYRSEERTTLYCWECNQRDNDTTQAAVPVTVLRARARNGHTASFTAATDKESER